LQDEKENWEKYEETKDRFIQVIAKNMNLYGITPSVGRLYGVLYFSEEPMTLDDMREALGMSKTSMSTGVRALGDMRMVEPAYKRGVRKDLYRSEEDWYKSFTALFGNRWKKQTESNIEETIDAIKKMEHLVEKTEQKQLKENIKQDLEKLYYAKNYYEWLMKFIHSMETGEIFKYIPKNDS
jgi:DNA-binding transcriptional regulator GbsR (MarR family)